jgi:hypothetical protein
VAGRALVFSNPQVIQLLQQRFVPYAGDQWYLHRRQDSEGEFFWKVVQQGHNRNQPLDNTRQGIYAASPDGHLLTDSVNTWSVERVLAMLATAEKAWQARRAPAGESRPTSNDRPATANGGAPLDPRFARALPEGGLALNVFSRIVEAPGGQWTPNRATGRDHMWLTREEWRALLPREWKAGAQVRVPRAVAHRLLRFHLVDNVRGEPNMWTVAEIREADLTLRVADVASRRLDLQGTARMQTPVEGESHPRGYEARLQGVLIYDRKSERITQLDILAWGEAWGEGDYTRGAPKGRFPLLIAFSLAGNKPADRVPPQASRNWREYWEAGG